MQRPDEPLFAVGDRVQKVGGDYTFEGVVVAVFRKLSGHVRYVIEDERGLLLIHSGKTIGLAAHDRRHGNPAGPTATGSGF